MPQRPKDRVRRAIVKAARRELALSGMTGATVGAIASRADTSVGNVYKYFPDKDALLDAAVPEEMVLEIRTLLSNRVEALGFSQDVGELGPGHPYHAATEELMRFALEHRDPILFLLVRAEGSVHQGFVDDVVRDLTRLALRYARGAYPGLRLGASGRRALQRIYRAFLVQIASVLQNETAPRSVRTAMAHLTDYHLTGLRGFFRAHSR